MIKAIDLSTENLSLWPTPKEFLRLCQSLVILTRCQNDWESYWFQNSSDGTQLARMHNGEGDTAEILFTPDVTLFKGFAHEAPMASWYTPDEKAYPGMFKNFPSDLLKLKKSFFDDEDISFATWFPKSDNQWRKGEVEPFVDIEPQDDPDGSKMILSYFPFNFEDYINEAEDYYSCKIDSQTVQAIYRHEPLTNEIIRKINKDCKFNIQSKEFFETGYPISSEQQ